MTDPLAFVAGADGSTAREILERIHRMPVSRENCGRGPCTFCNLNAELANIILQAALPQTEAVAPDNAGLVSGGGK